MARNARKHTTFKGIIATAGHTVFDLAVLSAHHTWQAGARVGRSLSPRHLALRFEAVKRTLTAEAEIASRR